MNQTEERIAQLIENKRVQKQKLEAAYLRAKEYRNSPGFVSDQDVTLEKIKGVAGGQAREWTADKALIAIGRIQEIIAHHEDRFSVIADYESIQKSIAEHLNQKG